MKPRRQLWGAIAGLIVAFFASDLAAQSTPPTAVPDGVVKIGLILDLTNPYLQVVGKGSATAAQMAAEDFGGKVLGAPIEVVTGDHHSNVDQAAAIARDWFSNQHVDAIVDVAGSSEALIVQAIAGTHDKIVILNTPGANRLTEEGCTATSVHYTNNTYAIAHSLARAIVANGSDTWFFITADYSYGYDLEQETGSVVRANGGKVLGSARHPFGASDFSAYLLQAQQSSAKVIGLANSGLDANNTIKRAAGFHMIPGPQLFAALSLRLNAVHDLGLSTAQGLRLTEAFYWDTDDTTRAWSKRFFERTGQMPNSLQAGVYSSTMHYLQAVQKAGTDATDPVMQAMRAAPIDDFFVHDGHIRADGLMVHAMRLFRVKTPAESKYPWDYYQPVTTIPGDQAFEPLSQSKCPLVKK